MRDGAGWDESQFVATLGQKAKRPLRRSQRDVHDRHVKYHDQLRNPEQREHRHLRVGGSGCVAAVLIGWSGIVCSRPFGDVPQHPCLVRDGSITLRAPAQAVGKRGRSGVDQPATGTDSAALGSALGPISMSSASGAISTTRTLVARDATAAAIRNAMLAPTSPR
jgi:hypothetical protein